VPFADMSLYRLPPSISNEAGVLLADILPTSYEVGVLAARVQPGDTVVIVGGGPIGLAAVLTARLYSPGRVIVVDPVGSRLDAAKAIGADITVNNGPGGDDPVALVHDITDDGLGADAVMEAVGIPATFELCTRLVRPGGHVANIGVHGAPATLHLEELWIKDVTITTGLVDTSSTPTLLRLVDKGQLDPAPIVTHGFALDEIMTAYDVFSDATGSGALKVVLNR
jgi:alcohol dehydrogenase